MAIDKEIDDVLVKMAAAAINDEDSIDVKPKYDVYMNLANMRQFTSLMKTFIRSEIDKQGSYQYIDKTLEIEEIY